MSSNIILGAGQIAQAIEGHIVGAPKMYDKGEWEHLAQTRCDILHICIPYTTTFDSIVLQAINKFSPTITVIHSTVKVGTSKKLGCEYSPVMGRHDNGFAQDLVKYAKPYAGIIAKYEIFKKNILLQTEFFTENTDELEFAKIMSTGYMYWNLIYEKSIARTCKERDYDLGVVYKQWNENYNNGVKKDWRRPIYTHNEDPLPGGHCLIPNTELDSNFINDFLREWTKKKGELHLTSF